jgi:lipopolysaccharide export system protein LptA
VNRARRAGRAMLVVLAAAFAGLLLLSYRKPGARTEGVSGGVAETLVKEAAGIRDRMRFGDFDYVERRGTEESYRLRASEALKFEAQGSQVYRLKDVDFTSRPAAGGRGFLALAPRAEFTDGSKAFRIFDGAQIRGQDATIRGASFRYDPTLRSFVSDGAVTALHGRLVGRADRGSVDTQSGVVFLNGNVRLRGLLDDGREIDLAAPKVELRKGGFLVAVGGAITKTDTFVLRCATLERSVEADGDRILAKNAARLLLMPDGRIPSAVVASGETLDLKRDSAGQPALLDVTTPGGISRLDVAPTARTGARRALTPAYTARFSAGRLADVTVPRDLDAAESAGSGGPPGAGLRHAVAGFARMVVAADGASLDVATFDKGVVFTDGTRATVRAPHGTLRGADEVAVFSGDPGTPATYRDEKGALVGNTIAYDRREDRIDAAGEVRASYAGESRTGLLGGASNTPLFSESETLRLYTKTSQLKLTGSVRAWQKDNVLRCRTLEVDDRTRALRAVGNVKAFFRREAPPVKGAAPPTAKAGTETINASGDVLTHREADGLVRIEGHARIVSGSWVMSSETADIRLAKDRSVEDAEARGSVVVEDLGQHRRGEGSHARWLPGTELVTLEGSPATAIDGKGNRATGALITFRQGSSQVEVKTSGTVPSETVLKPEAR